MAEALAVVGIVANIIQLVDFGTRVLERLDQYQCTLAETPEVFRHIRSELPVLIDALRQTRAAIDAGLVPDESKKALGPAIEGCSEQIKALDEVIGKLLPTSGDSWTRRGRKAWRSVRYDAKVEKIRNIIRGYVQTLTYHAAASTRPPAGHAVSRPTPSSTVPFRRDPHFVDRQVLAEINHKSQQPASRVALVGLGGVGKSQLAVEYSYRTRGKSPDTWVFWVHGANTARFTEGFRIIAERAKIPGWDKPDVDVLKIVYNWLCDDANGHWLMIIDNADDLSVYSQPSEQTTSGRPASLLDYLPQSSNGSFLITSRSREAAFLFTGDYADILQVKAMDQSDALSLLRKKLGGGEFVQDDAAALVEALDYMPLAISQAAGYISQRAPLASVSKYLDNVRKGDQDRARLLGIDIKDTRRDGTASNSIMATWQISFQHIRRKRPSATQLLSLMSLFDRQGIPASLLDGRYQNHSDTDPDRSHHISLEFEDDMNTLMSFSLITANVDGTSFEMHRLVQFSTKKWLEINEELEQWKETYAMLMEDQFPAGEYDDWDVCQALFPHAQAVVDCQPKGTRALEAWASVLYRAACYAHGMGQYQEAYNMDSAAHQVRETILGAEHRDTLGSLNSLGIDLNVQGRYDEAAAIREQVLDTSKRVFGVDHFETLTSMNNLAITY